MTDHTPTVDEVRAMYVTGTPPHLVSVTQGNVEFDRFLAAHDEQVRADERRRIATAIEARRGVGYVSTSTCEFADGARAALTAAAEIARTGSGEAT